MQRKACCSLNAIDVLEGMLPSLQYLVFRHVDAIIQAYKQRKLITDPNLQQVSIGLKPNSYKNS